MKYYVKHEDKKVYLSFRRDPHTRWEVIAQLRGAVEFAMFEDSEKETFIHINDIVAEVEYGMWDAVTRVVIASVIGLLIGPVGVLICGGFALLDHLIKRSRDTKMAKLFNEDKLYLPPDSLEDVEHEGNNDDSNTPI